MEHRDHRPPATRAGEIARSSPGRREARAAEAVENRRLGRLGEIAYDVCRGILAVPSVPHVMLETPLRDSAEEIYAQGLRREIEESYSSRPGTLGYFLEMMRDGSVEGYGEDDRLAAIRILGAFLETALLIESRHGDSPGAVEALRDEVPGLPDRLYFDKIGFYGYINC